MAARRHERSRSRRAALQVLYSCELTGASPKKLENSDVIVDGDARFDEYAVMLTTGVYDLQKLLDVRIEEASDNWTLDRMPIIDRAILRLSVYEMTFVDYVPISVTINEAIDLAKEYGGDDDSHRFVNGVLGRIARRLEPSSGLETELASDEQPAEVDDSDAPSEETLDVAMPEEKEGASV